MPDSNPQYVEETNIYDILETLLRGWKLMAVFLALGLVVAWLWLAGGPAPGLMKSTLEVVWSPGYLPPSFTVQVPAGRPLSAYLGPAADAEESIKITATWPPASVVSLPNPIKTLWASFQASPAALGKKNMALESLRQESLEPAKLVWTCQTTNQAAALEILEALNDLADRFEQYILNELKQPNNDLRVRYETALAAAEKALAGQEAVLAALRAESLKGSSGGQDGKQPPSGEVEDRLLYWRNRENDLLTEMAFQEAQKTRWRFLLNQLAATEAWPVLRRAPSVMVIDPESRRALLVKAAGLVFLALVLGGWSVFAAEGWRRHRAKRRASAGLDGLKG